MESLGERGNSDLACRAGFGQANGLIQVLSSYSPEKESDSMLQFVKILWALPNTLIGVTAGILGLLTGGSYQLHSGCLEFHGGLVTWALERMPLTGGVLAMTLGHSVIGQTAEGLDVSRDHERIHVRQYERWGPFFLPAYLAVSVWLWCVGRDCYRENPFEVEAYAKADPGVQIVHPDSPE